MLIMKFLLLSSLPHYNYRQPFRREWTSADGSRTFQGELTGFQDGKVKVRRSDGRDLSSPLNFSVNLTSNSSRPIN